MIVVTSQKKSKTRTPQSLSGHHCLSPVTIAPRIFFFSLSKIFASDWVDCIGCPPLISGETFPSVRLFLFSSLLRATRPINISNWLWPKDQRSGHKDCITRTKQAPATPRPLPLLPLYTESLRVPPLHCYLFSPFSLLTRLLPLQSTWPQAVFTDNLQPVPTASRCHIKRLM